MEASIQSVGDSGLTSPRVAHTGSSLVATPARDGSKTVQSLVNEYMAVYAGRDTTRVQRLTWWCARLGSVTLDALSDDHVFAALEALAEQRGRHYMGKDADGQPIMKAKWGKLAPATLNRYQNALSAVLTWAQRRRITPKGWQNPCTNVELKVERNSIVRFLSDEERTALLAACRASTWSRLYLFVLLAITTGARRGELEALRWRDIDLERGEASVNRSKNGDKKMLVLTEVVVAELRRFSGPPTTLVFASTRRPDVAYNFNPAWTLALKQAGVRNCRVHDLRHTCASYLAQAGAPLLEIAEVLGHRQLSVTRRYSHLTTKHKAELVTRVLGSIR